MYKLPFHFLIVLNLKEQNMHKLSDEEKAQLSKRQKVVF